MTAATTILTTLQAYPALGYMGMCMVCIGIGALITALVAWFVRP